MRPWLVIFALLHAVDARANEPLERAQQALATYEYEGIVDLLADALEAAANDSETIEAYRLMAVYHATFDRTELAVEAFDEILRRNPAWELDGDASPKLRQALDRARQGRASPTAPSPPSAGNTEPRAAATSPVAPAETEARLMSRYWWVWTGVAVLLAGTAAGAWALSRSEVPNSDLGPYPLGP